MLLRKLKLIQIFERRITEPDIYYEMASEAVNKLSFFGVNLHNESGRSTMKNCLLESDNKEIPQACRILVLEKWPNEVEKTLHLDKRIFAR